MSKQKIPPFKSSIIEGISKIFGDTADGLTGSEIEKFLEEANIPDTSLGITKWKRLYNAFGNIQNQKQNSNNILKFINITMNPARFVGKPDEYEHLRNELNKRLAFVSLELKESGKFSRTDGATTISEAQQKANKLKYKLEQRNTHPIIFKYCKAELLAENYFHTVFEATKSIAESIRNRTGLTEDGALLIDKSFSIAAPLIKINELKTETEISEHKGLSNLIKGVFGMFRNTTAHAPKMIWEINEDDALDILSTISLIHRKLDSKR